MIIAVMNAIAFITAMIITYLRTRMPSLMMNVIITDKYALLSLLRIGLLRLVKRNV